MKTIEIDLGERSYDIRIAHGLIGKTEELLPWVKGDHAVIVTNEVIANWYLEPVRAALSGKKVETIILPDGEQTKTLETTWEIFDRLLAVPCDRKTTLIALGGGVVGDMTGFVAACYQRGVPFIQIPTTLLSQVDSSVGGKTAVNHPRGKNMIGAFYQPLRVIADTGTLETLGDEEFASGMAEVIKYGVINDPDFFDWLEENMADILKKSPDALAFMIERSCINKAAIVEQDEKEGGIRALLNLGHTFGHAIESGFGYGKWLHGQAVAMGMVMAAHMSWQLGWIDQSVVQRIKTLLNSANLPTEPFSGLDPQQMFDLMHLDKKVENCALKLVLLRGIGEAVVTTDYSKNQLRECVDFFASP